MSMLLKRLRRGTYARSYDHDQRGGRRANSVHRGASQSRSMVLLAGTPWAPGAGLGALRMQKVGSLAPTDRHGRRAAHQLAVTGARALPDGPGPLTRLDDRQRPLGPPKVFFLE